MHLFKIVLVIISTGVRDVFTTECLEMGSTRTRIFPSLISFQSNKAPFNPSKSNKGNYVSFSFKEMDNLPKNAFVTFDSEHIIKLDLSGKSIRRIDDGAFLSLTCLSFLTVANNNISELTWQTFEGLENLKELDLSKNKLRTLPDMAFALTNRLKKLDLSQNLLRAISAFSFSNITDLLDLNLSSNNLVYIKTQVFQPLIHLVSLDVSFNKLYDTGFDSWILPNLEVLNLSRNYLKNFDTSLNYTFVNLQKLNLSINHLTKLNIHALNRNFPKLNLIDLNQNYWRCDYLARVLHFLADSKLQIPAKNTSEINELGIECDNDTQISDFSETFSTTTSTIVTPTHNLTINNNNNFKIDDQIHGMSIKNDEILLEISGIRKLLIFCLLSLVLFVIIYASVQVGLCGGIQKKFGRRQGYIDTSIQDNYSMLRS